MSTHCERCGQPLEDKCESCGQPLPPSSVNYFNTVTEARHHLGEPCSCGKGKPTTQVISNFMWGNLIFCDDCAKGVIRDSRVFMGILAGFMILAPVLAILGTLV